MLGLHGCAFTSTFSYIVRFFLCVFYKSHWFGLVGWLLVVLLLVVMVVVLSFETGSPVAQAGFKLAL